MTAAPATRMPGAVQNHERLVIGVFSTVSGARMFYLRWLPNGLSGLIGVEHDDDRSARFYPRGLRVPLLVLAYARDRSTTDRQLFFVTDGLLVARRSRGRFELRQVLDGGTLFTATFDFAPSLPWWIYRATQALFHAGVMASFARHLEKAQPTGKGAHPMDACSGKPFGSVSAGSWHLARFAGSSPGVSWKSRPTS